jgi:hypothetical protein
MKNHDLDVLGHPEGPPLTTVTAALAGGIAYSHRGRLSSAENDRGEGINFTHCEEGLPLFNLIP